MAGPHRTTCGNRWRSGIFGNLDLSPDGQQVAVSKRTPRPVVGAQTDIWLMDLATGSATRLTDDPAGNFDATWSPDGKHIVFNSRRLEQSILFMRASDGSGVDVPLVKSETDHFTVASWSRANVLIFNVFNDRMQAIYGHCPCRETARPRSF